MKNIKTNVMVLAIGVLCASTLALVTMPGAIASAQTNTVDTGAPASGTGCSQYFLTFPAWYRGLVDGSCEIISPDAAGGFSPFIWKIVLNVVEMILNAVGYAAVAYIIYGGYKYMISAGSPDGMVGARKTIMNAVIGLAISIAAVAIVRTISNGMAGIS